MVTIGFSEGTSIVVQRLGKGEETRRQIVREATALFAERGFEATSIELVLERTGLSRGALYHHFENKAALFTAVLDAVEVDIAARLTAAAVGAKTPHEMLRAGCAAWLELASDRAVRQIALVDAPSVVGWQTWRDIENQHALGLLRAALAGAAAAGQLPAAMVDTYAHVLLAALIELAHLVALAPDAEAARANGRRASDELLGAMFRSTGARSRRAG